MLSGLILAWVGALTIFTSGNSQADQTYFSEIGIIYDRYLDSILTCESPTRYPTLPDKQACLEPILWSLRREQNTFMWAPPEWSQKARLVIEHLKQMIYANSQSHFLCRWADLWGDEFSTVEDLFPRSGKDPMQPYFERLSGCLCSVPDYAKVAYCSAQVEWALNAILQTKPLPRIWLTERTRLEGFFSLLRAAHVTYTYYPERFPIRLKEILTHEYPGFQNGHANVE